MQVCHLCSNSVNVYMCNVCRVLLCGKRRVGIKSNSHTYIHYMYTNHGIYSNKYNDLICINSSCKYNNYISSVMSGIVYIIYSINKQMPLELYLLIGNNEKESRSKEDINDILICIVHMYSIFNRIPINTNEIEKRLSKIFNRCIKEEYSDPARFFRNVISFMKRYEYNNYVSDIFYMHIKSIISCKGCKEKWDKSEKVSILYLKPEQSVMEYFSFKQLDTECRCGEPTRAVFTHLTNTPTVLTLRVKKPINNILGVSYIDNINMQIELPTTNSSISIHSPEHTNTFIYTTDQISTFINHSLSSGLSIPPETQINLLSKTEPDQKTNNSKEKHPYKTNKTNKHSSPALLKYTLKAVLIQQTTETGNSYGLQMNNTNTTLDTSLWDTYIDNTITKEVLFKEDIIILYYLLTK
ncbi:hypothetical protein NEOKW01_0087 [Nematocida sp. AWRm80]|nr:hypothetical protein NEOKW01_0087 [Nematocida sp. AWRm80]